MFLVYREAYQLQKLTKNKYWLLPTKAAYGSQPSCQLKLKIPWYLLKLSYENENMSQADDSVKIWWNLPISNPKPDLHNINAHTKFGENPLKFTQVIIHKQNTDRWTDRRTYNWWTDGQTHKCPTWNHNKTRLLKIGTRNFKKFFVSVCIFSFFNCEFTPEIRRNKRAMMAL